MHAEQFCISAIKEIYIYSFVSNKIYVRHKYAFEILQLEPRLIELSISRLNFHGWIVTPNSEIALPLLTTGTCRVFLLIKKKPNSKRLFLESFVFSHDGTYLEMQIMITQVPRYARKTRSYNILKRAASRQFRNVTRFPSILELLITYIWQNLSCYR